MWAQPGHRLYVSNEGDNTVSVIDTRTGEVEKTVSAGGRPRGMGLSPDGSKLYVALGDDDAIGVIDTNTLEQVKTIPAGSDPEAFAVHPNGAIYLSNEDEAKTTVLDPATGEIVAEIPVGIEPEGVGVSPDGKYVMVTSESTSMVHVIDTEAHEVVKNILVPARPREVVFTRGGRWAYVSCEVAGEIVKLDVENLEIAQQARLRTDIERAKPKGLQLSHDEETLYVSTGRGAAIAVVDAETLELRETIPVGRRVWGIALSADGSRLYAANGLDNSVSVVNTESNEEIRRIPVGERPWGAVLDDGPRTVSSREGRLGIDPSALETFIDGVIRSYRKQRRVAGLTLAVVKNGETILLKNYGIAALDPERPVEAKETLFRIGSISKTFTWTALMQLAEQGKLTIEDPVNQHLPPELQIPDEGYAKPIRIRHLMSHTPGFEDSIQALFENKTEELLTPDEFLQYYRPARVRPPGEVIAYSNYGVGLGGKIVEQVSGMPFEDYVEQNILEPLGMTRTTFRQPVGEEEDQQEDQQDEEEAPEAITEDLLADVSSGFTWENAYFQPQDFELITIPAAGSASSTARDMARWMRAHLDDGALNGARILKAETAQKMREKLFSNAEAIPGVTHGFIEYRFGKYRGLGHAGGTLSFFSNLVMIPELRFGIFLSANTGGAAPLTRDLPGLVVERFFPEARPAETPAPPDDFAERGKRFTGTYLANRRSYTKLEKLFVLFTGGFMKVSLADGYLVTSGPEGTRRWVEIASLTFQELGGGDRLVFREENGDVAGLSTGFGLWEWEKVNILQAPAFLGIMALLGLLTSATILLGLWRRRKPPEQSKLEIASFIILVGTALAWIIFYVTAGAALSEMASKGLQAVYDYPTPLLKNVLGLAVLASILTGVCVVFLIPVWQRRNWSLGRRFRHTLAVVILAGLVGSLYQWNVLGYNYFKGPQPPAPEAAAPASEGAEETPAADEEPGGEPAEPEGGTPGEQPAEEGEAGGEADAPEGEAPADSAPEEGGGEGSQEQEPAGQKSSGAAQEESGGRSAEAGA